MKERPILFNGEMVRAVLDGRKTQTRRVVKPQIDDAYWPVAATQPGEFRWLAEGETTACRVEAHRKCPYGQTGDRLWVRETWWHHKSDYLEQSGFVGGTITLLDSGPSVFNCNAKFDPSHHKEIWRKRPSIHMPRWASRILLEITDIRVERVQDITRLDAKAEGFLPGLVDPWVWVVEFKRIETQHNAPIRT